MLFARPRHSRTEFVAPRASYLALPVRRSDSTKFHSKYITIIIVIVIAHIAHTGTDGARTGVKRAEMEYVAGAGLSSRASWATLREGTPARVVATAFVD